VLAQALACAVLTAAQPAPAGQPLKPWSGGETPALALRDLQGQERRLEEFRGKAVVINFWATWCEPCRDELPSLDRLKTHFAGAPLEVLAVDVGEGEARVRDFLKSAPVKFPVLLDRDGKAQREWGVRGLPTTFVLDPSGRIRYSFVGERDWSDEEVKSAVRALLPQPGKPQVVATEVTENSEDSKATGKPQIDADKRR
jgi:thiol-disulfide isomerase/thioredoxin